ncbi:putative protein shortage in chiasmata 1 [Helianthus debilis subsp. tardiflorus]
MRTRFLTDVFNSSAASNRLQTLDFLRFPPPELPSADQFIFNNISCFDQLNFITVAPEIDTISVNESLCKFLSDVLPQAVSTEIDRQIVTEVASEVKIKEDGTFTLVEFETPELCISLEDSSVLHEEKIQIFFEVTDSEFPTDLLDFSLELQPVMDIRKSIFYVEDICLEIQEEHKSDLLKDGSSVRDQTRSDLRSFPVLEVDEISLGINSCIYEDKHTIFESNDLQQWMQKDELTSDSNELLLSMKFDISENLLNHSSSKCRKFEVPCVNVSPEYIIDAIEQPLMLIPLALEQLEFFDTKTAHFSQVFSDIESIGEVEHFEQMFGNGNTALSVFNNLIVTHELVLTDDSFKSLPVPIISDHENILSVQTIVEEIFITLKLQPSSTSDDIYLDWHLLEEDICSRSKHASLKMFEDIDTYHINADISSCDSLVLEFVLSDACSNEQTTKENTEVLNIERFGNLMEHVVSDKIYSSEICKKHVVNKAHQFVESKSQFDDLDFFLNPLEATYVKKQKSVDTTHETDVALPMVLENDPIETHDAGRKQHQSLENETHSVKRGDFHSTLILNEISKNLEGPLHSTHTELKNSMESTEATYEVPQLPVLTESKKVNTNRPIIVNTQNGETEMLISRRSTYQKILAMEKEGIQVVERDLNLPVDVIISAAVCLVLYDSNNIIKKTNSSDGASSLSSCVENIAANVLTSLSFALSGCVLIFEGEVGFLGGIMESSDELYAAAASLGIDLQLFYSYSSETTDVIILNCIANAAKSTRGVYPRMPESETLAESFLSKFTSLNPLSAHAILSSVGTLLEFFEMSHQQRVCALQKYLVPQASVLLFSSLCRYGEREDSRSGMTDCCSSVSSGHDSGYCCPKVDHEKKKRKYVASPETKAMPVDYVFQWDHPKSVNSHMFWNSEGDEICDGIEKSNIDFDEIYFRSDARMMPHHPTLTEASFGQNMPIPDKIRSHTNKREIIHIDDGEDIFDLSKNQRSDARMMPNHPSLTESSFGQRKKAHMPVSDMFNAQSNKGEIIDINDDAMTSEWFDLPSFSTAAEINSDLDSDLMNNNAPFKGKVSCYGRTPLSKAISCDQPQKGSPWTIDFLNRIKEKSRTRHQSLPNISSAPCFGYSGNNALKCRKRKSPSILDFYRYTSGSMVKSMEHNGQKGHIQAPSSSKAVQTPIDKRAKRRLTFSTNGSKGQSKLMWSDKANQTMKGRL